MAGGPQTRFIISGLIFLLFWSHFVCAQSIREETCPPSSRADLPSVAVVIDSVELPEDIGLTPEIRR
jgi:hypothetical protein